MFTPSEKAKTWFLGVHNSCETGYQPALSRIGRPSGKKWIIGGIFKEIKRQGDKSRMNIVLKMFLLVPIFIYLFFLVSLICKTLSSIWWIQKLTLHQPTSILIRKSSIFKVSGQTRVSFYPHHHCWGLWERRNCWIEYLISREGRVFIWKRKCGRQFFSL